MARQRVRTGVAFAAALAVVAGLVLAPGSAVSAQSVADVVVRDRLIAEQENLLNTYRCLFGVDVGAVPGGCPNPDVVSPGPAPASPTQHDLAVRDGLIQSQEALLNTYRCGYNIDTEIVPGGCPETGESQPTPVFPVDSGSGPRHCPGVSDLRYYCDVEPDYYDDHLGRPAGATYDSVNRLAGLGVFEGTDCAKDTFCSEDPVDGKTFATWLVRVLEGRGDAAGAAARLVELGIAARCSGRPDALCPSGKLNRAELATFISRAIDLPAADAIGFWDVGEDSGHFNNINRLVASGIDDGCSEIRFVPFNFCPDHRVTRGEMAQTLSEVIDYIEAQEIIEITKDSETDNSIGLAASYDEDSDVTTVTWSNPKKSGDVSQYVLQWRPSWDGFNYQRYQMVEPKSKGKYKVEFNPPIAGSEIYAVRVITAYDNKDKDRLATDEVKVPSKSHNLRDLIKDQVIDAYGDEQPWLVDTWRHLNGPKLSLYEGKRSRVNWSDIGGHGFGQLEQAFASSFSISHSTAARFERHISRGGGTVSHELGHVYTLTNGITENEAAVATGHLYLKMIAQEYATYRCSAQELYADLAILAFQGTYPQFRPDSSIYGGTYWVGCELDMDQKTKNRVVREVKDLTKKVFLDQEMPQWFYDEYQNRDRSIDLDDLWSDIVEYGAGSTGLIMYGLKDEFGGYCSNEEVRQFVAGEVDSIETPWRDSGNCPDDEESIIYS